MTTLHRIAEGNAPAFDNEARPADRASPAYEPSAPRPRIQRQSGNVRDIISRAAFRARFTTHLTKALVAHGIDAPERLLFMSEEEIHNIPGVGKGAVAEIQLYRDRFLPRSAFASRAGD